MNLIAVDIGNTNVSTGLFLDDRQEYVETIPGTANRRLAACLETAWSKIPASTVARAHQRKGAIVLSSVRATWTERIEQIAMDKLGQKTLLIGRDIPLPMPLWVDEPEKVGTDRIVSAAAAYAVIEDAVVVADFGTAVTIDLIDDNGVFRGGTIFPGFDISAAALQQNTAKLPKISVSRPHEPYGTSTAEAINCGLYYSTIGALEEIIRRYAEKIGKWPHTIITGSGAGIIKDDCGFIDSFVPDLALKGIFLAYRRHLEDMR
jgi:type III pantothenate kinase